VPDERPPDDGIWPGAWAGHVRGEIEAVEHGRAVAMAAEPATPHRTATSDAVRASLDLAGSAIRQRHRLRGPVDRWRGLSVERAYHSLHTAKVELVDLLSDEEVDALRPAALARLATCLPEADARRVELERLPPGSGPRTRAVVKAAMSTGYEASDRKHTQIRGFRNVLLSAFAMILLLMVALVVVLWMFPQAMPLCFNPDVTGTPVPQTSTGFTVCPSGDGATGRPPSPEDALIVAGLGLLGGALAAAVAIRKIRGTSIPYDVPVAAAMLKVPSGALAAVAGMLLLGGGFVPGFSELDSQRQVLAYALVFGYAQQLATRFIDDKAQSLLDAMPGKEPAAQ
jgi:hypothetical protein